MGITTTFANLTDGLQSLALFDQAFAQAGQGSIPNPTVVSGSAVIPNGTRVVAIVADAPTATTLLLPTILGQDKTPLTIVDLSTNVSEHTITLDAQGTNTIMRLASFQIISTTDQLASITLNPATSLGIWYFP